MSEENFAGNIIVNLASLPDFLRGPILKRRMAEFFSLSGPEKREIINNALEAGPTIPFPSFAKLLRTWMKNLSELSEEQRAEMFSEYIDEMSRSPQKLIAFHMDWILEVFLSLEEHERGILAGTISTVVRGLEEDQRRRVTVMIPDSAKGHLGL